MGPNPSQSPKITGEKTFNPTHRGTRDAMEQFFNPKSIAVIGANDKPNSIGSALMDNIIQGGFTGTVIPINPHHETIHGLKAYGTVTEVDPAPEMAIIATRSEEHTSEL